MSYILNALRKSEQQRQRQNIETLEKSIQGKQESRSKPLFLGIIALIVINLCFLLYFGWSFTKEKQVGATVKTIISKKPASIKVKPAKKGVTTVPTTLEEIQSLSIAEQIKSNKAKVKPIRKQQKSAKPKLDMAREVKSEKRLQALMAKKTSAYKVVTEKQKGDFPFLSELEYEFRRKVPDMAINVYVYAKKQQDRFVMINMKKYQSGQEIAPGMILKEIRINSLVMAYNNRVFQIKRK